jgi:pantothenate kinase type III
MTNLVIDAGNSRVKLFVFKADKVLVSLVCDENQICQTIEKLFSTYAFENTIVSSVGGMTTKNSKCIGRNDKCFVFVEHGKTPF